MKDRKKLLVSFSGGETSAYMAYLLANDTYYKENFEIVYVFANTGEENEETLLFVNQVAKEFEIKVNWVEAVVYHNQRKASTHKIVDFESASRSGVDSSFEEVIRKYGIPNMATPHCTRELKANPIKSFAKSMGWKDYYTAIGIRLDEIDRVSVNWRKNRFIYPLINDKPMTKQHINFWWKNQSFRLNLEEHQGNCKWCWKKSTRKLLRLAQESSKNFDFPLLMESKYGRFIPNSRIKRLIEKGINLKDLFPITFFRGHKSSLYLIEQSKKAPNLAVSHSQQSLKKTKSLYSFNNDTMKCEPFAECSNENLENAA